MSAAYLKGPPAPPTIRVNYWCEGKEPFDSGKLAAEVAARSTRGPRNTYFCKACGAFHVGSATDKSFPAAAKAVSQQLIRLR